MNPVAPAQTGPLPYRLLALLRDAGACSRAELADRLDVPRPRLLAELDAPGRGRADPRGRAGRVPRRAALHPGRARTRTCGSPPSTWAPSRSTWRSPTAGWSRSRRYAEPADIRSGPKVILHAGQRDPGQVQGRRARTSGSQAIGIGVPGPVSFRDGVPVSPPIMPGWDRYPVREVLGREHGCPVVVDNDVNIMAIGERYGGVAHSVDNLLFLKVGTGIGCGIYLGGEVYRGTDGCAGDIGHIQVDDHGPVCSCGNVGCLEALFGGAALARDAHAAAQAGTSPALAERLAANGTLDRPGRRGRRGRGRRRPASG